MTRYGILRVAAGMLVMLVLLLPAIFEARIPTEEDPFPRFMKSLKLHDMTMVTWNTGQDVFEAPIAGCSGRVQFLAESSILEDQRVIEEHLPAGGVKTFLYLDRSWSQPDHFAVWAARAVAQAGNLFRTRPLTNLAIIIEIVSPTRCEAATTIDWAAFWNDSSPRLPQRAGTAVASLWRS